MIGRWAKLGIFGALFVVAFLVGLRLTFPMSLVTRMIEAQIEEASGYELDAEIGGSRFSGIVGIRLRDVSLRPAGEGEEGEVVLPLELDSVRVTASPLSLIRRNPSLRADIRIDDGRIRAAYEPGSESTTIRATLFDVELRRIPQVRDFTGLPATGEVSGTVVLEYGEGWQLSGGNIELGVEALVFGPGDIESQMFRQFGGSVPLPATRFGNVVLRVPIEGTNVTIEQLEASGADVRLDASGEVHVREPMRTSRVDVDFSFQLDGNYVEAAGLGAVFGLPELQRLQSGDGYAFAISGPLSRPSIVPASRRGL